MSKIRSKDTKPELALRKALFARGFRFRVNDMKPKPSCKNCQGSLILFYLNTKQLFSYMAVFGMDMRDVNMLILRKQILNFGLIKLLQMQREIKRFFKNLRRWAGMS